jgi:hypothetical protein
MGDGSLQDYRVRRHADTALGSRIFHAAADNPAASHREIGRVAGCTHQTVGAYLRAEGLTGHGGHWRTGTGAMQQFTLTQAKPEGIEAIDALLAHEGVLFTRHVRQPRGYSKLPQVIWLLTASYSGELLKRSGYDHANPVPFVLSLSPSQRETFLRGVFGAEGHQDAPREAFGRGPYPGQKVYAQADGPPQDAITLAVYLSGKRPSIHSMAPNPLAKRQAALIGERKPFKDGKTVHRKAAGHGPVWCPTTGLGTWTARQGRQVFLMGNSGVVTRSMADSNERMGPHAGDMVVQDATDVALVASKLSFAITSAGLGS